MGENWHLKPADKFVRPRRIKPFRLRRVLGIPGLFSIGYGDVGSSIYYALGVIAFVALGATPIALGIAGLLYIFNALTYAEGSAMVTEGGGSAAYARWAYNDLAGFIAGWCLMLSYIVTVAIAAYTIPPYLSHFWPILSHPVPGTLVSIGIILFLMLMNFVGIGEWSGINVFFVTFDIVVQIILIVLGLILILAVNPAVLFQHMFGPGNWPSAGNLIFGIAIAALCFNGVESVAQHAEEARRPEKKMPQTYILMVVTVVLLFAGVSIVALSAMTPQQLGDPSTGWARNPVAGIASAVSSAIVPDQIVSGIKSESARSFLSELLTYGRNLIPGLVSILASAILLMATNTGILGISRLSYNLSKHRQLPASMSRIHRRFRTPYLSIVIFSLVSVVILLPGFFSTRLFANLAALYVFGSLLVFAFAHASILRLRMTNPDLPRPFRILGNIKVRGYKLPITTVLGLVSTIGIWLIVIIIQPYSWWIGIAWLITGFLVYYIYRKSKKLPLLHTPDGPASDKHVRE
jgi:APA family basic amino acid/polyamine antiporter